ncbi:MAG: hypothetical protein QNJ54_28845, partial [Prochloraceae cyanobacterium]|nr:hypothetical protein [Prochloraceae cyanobacterium]
MYLFYFRKGRLFIVAYASELSTKSLPVLEEQEQKTIFNAANCFFERYISFGGLIEVALSLRTQFERESKTKSERAFALFLNKT